jgi:hypothetical protein
VDAPSQITEEGEADIVTLGYKTVKRQELLIIDPQELEIRHRYLLPFMLAEAVMLNTEVKTPLNVVPFEQLVYPEPLSACHS